MKKRPVMPNIKKETFARKLFLIFSISFIALITACSQTPDWNAALVQTPSYIEGNSNATQASNSANENSNAVQASIASTPGRDPSSLMALQITDNQGAPVVGLEVQASFEMVRMDHGTIEAQLTETENNLYEGYVALPMAGTWEATITMIGDQHSKQQTFTFDTEKPVTSSDVAGSSSSSMEAAQATKSKSNAQPKAQLDSAAANETVATVAGKSITELDIEFYQFINELQIAMYKEQDQKRLDGEELKEAMSYWEAQEAAAKHPNTLLTQSIRLHAAALLAEEKGHMAADTEINEALKQVKAVYEQSPAASSLIEKFGEEQFWKKQRSQYELIVLSEKAQQDVLQYVQQANPDAPPHEQNVLAQMKWEELLISQISSLEVNIY